MLVALSNLSVAELRLVHDGPLLHPRVTLHFFVRGYHYHLRARRLCAARALRRGTKEIGDVIFLAATVPPALKPSFEVAHLDARPRRPPTRRGKFKLFLRFNQVQVVWRRKMPTRIAPAVKRKHATEGEVPKTVEMPTLARAKSPTTMEKRRRLDPSRWTADEVACYMMARCSLTAHAASAMGVDGAELFALANSGAWADIKGVPARKQAAVRQTTAELFDPLMPKFMLYDWDSSGDLDYDEFKHLAEQVTGQLVPDDDFKVMMAKIDLDANGTVSFAEFKQFVDSCGGAEGEGEGSGGGGGGGAHHPLARSLRHLALDSLVGVEGALLGAVQPYLAHGCKPSLALLHADLPPVQRLALPPRSKRQASCVALVVLGALALLAFPFALALCDAMVPDRTSARHAASASAAGKASLAFSEVQRTLEESASAEGARRGAQKWAAGHDAGAGGSQLTPSACLAFFRAECGWGNRAASAAATQQRWGNGGSGGEDRAGAEARAVASLSWGDRDKRRCSKKLHADKRGGGGSGGGGDNGNAKFVTLIECSEQFKAARPTFVLVFIRKCAAYVAVVVVLASFSSTSAAVAFAAWLAWDAPRALG